MLPRGLCSCGQRAPGLGAAWPSPRGGHTSWLQRLGRGLLAAGLLCGHLQWREEPGKGEEVGEASLCGCQGG